KPLEGAEVAAVARVRPERPADGAGQLVLARGKTDAEGRFRTVLKDAPRNRIQNFQVLAGARGHSLGWRQLSFEENRPEVELRLRGEQVLPVRLINLQGQAADKVKVRVEWVTDVPSGDRRDPRALAQRRIQEMRPLGMQQRGDLEFLRPAAKDDPPWWPPLFTSDAQGRFEVHSFGQGQTVHLLIEGEARFARQVFPVQLEKAGKEVTLVLGGAQRVQGKLVFADTGKPAPDIYLGVHSLRSDLRPGDPGFHPKSLTHKTDAQGRFSIYPYPGDTFTIDALAPRGEPYLG